MKIPSFLFKPVLRFLDKHASDEKYLSWMFFSRLGYWPNLRHPKSFNEKLQWMKIHDHNPLFSLYADKYRVREHIVDTIGEKYLIPMIGVYDKAEDIDFDALPNQFVLKCNHGAGCNVICKDKSELDREEVLHKLNGWMAKDFSHYKREYHYASIERKIICEQFMLDKESGELRDYKFFCIGGEIQMIQVDMGRFSRHTRNIYDRDWNLLDVEISFPRDTSCVVESPKELEEMKRIAETLSKEFLQVRVDLYVINHQVYFGELTFFSGAGFSKYNPRQFEFDLGSKLHLSIDKE